MDFRSKRYADRAVQTTHICAGLSCTQLLDLSDTSQTSIGHEENSVVGVAGSSRSGYKQTGIGSGHPSDRICETKRLLSLPSAIGTTECSVLRADGQARVVSMPERNKHGDLEHPMHTEASCVHLSDSTDASYYSVASDQAPVFQLSENERLYPVDLPLTPSPPSSPDSVMIIGNENKVAGSFLRRSSTDADGWTSWASSPPRPIPALHGPLSLPYARCPSGAEGTVVDGDDLSNKIWGLTIQDDTQGSNSRFARPAVNQTQRQQGGARASAALSHTQRRENLGPESSLQRGSQITINLSKPNALRNLGDISSGFKTPQKMNRGTTLEFSVAGDLQKLDTIVRTCDIDYSKLLDTSNSQFSKLTDSQALPGNEPFGLGVNWNGSSYGLVNGPTFNNDTCDGVNTAFPAFVLAHGKGVVYGHPGRERSRTSMSTERDTTTRTRTSTLYSLQPDCNSSAMTVASTTASPNWHSTFPQSFEIAKQKAILPRHIQHYSAQYSPRIYSPQLESHANRLGLMMGQLCEDPADYSTYTGFPAQKNVTLTETHYGSAFEQFDTPPGQNELAFFPNGSNTHESMMPVQELGHPEPGQLDETDIVFSSERRRNLSHQQPRSIPLARLIQRRLSAVAEEDGSLLPLLHQRMSRLLVKQPRSEANASICVNNMSSVSHGNFENLEGAIESTVSVEDTPSCASSSTAVVNLPRNTTLAHRKLARNNTGILKENVGHKPLPAIERLKQGKPNQKQKKSDTPFRLATNSIS